MKITSTTTTTEALTMTTSSNETKTKHNHHRRTVHRNFVFGYGSLICPESRKITNPDLGDEDALPVIIRNVERVWSARSVKSGYTAMGVRFREGAECTGVLVEVKGDKALADLDVREANYNRLPILLDNIEQVPFLPEEEYYDDDHPVFEAKDNPDSDITSDNEYVKVWIYMQKDPIPADPSHPIPQSYVDIIIRGCLTISEEFARSFIETTKGWHPPNVSDTAAAVITDDNNNNNNNASGSDDDDINHRWVDDREEPLYVRADPEFSLEHSDIIDSLFEEHTPIALENRVEYVPEEHLEALEEALEEDLAHPKAIKKIESIIAERSSSDGNNTDEDDLSSKDDNNNSNDHIIVNVKS